jgi:hypothetical protein
LAQGSALSIIFAEWIESSECSLKRMAGDMQLPQSSIGLALIAHHHKVHVREVKAEAEDDIRCVVQVATLKDPDTRMAWVRQTDADTAPLLPSKVVPIRALIWTAGWYLSRFKGLGLRTCL